MTPPSNETQRTDERDGKRVETADLDSLYGRIGFPAVAAAAHYPVRAVKSADAPARTRREEDASA